MRRDDRKKNPMRAASMKQQKIGAYLRLYLKNKTEKSIPSIKGSAERINIQGYKLASNSTVCIYCIFF